MRNHKAAVRVAVAKEELDDAPTWSSFGPIEPAARAMRIAFLERSRPLLIEYCRQKLDAEDFHGVADAAMDLRDLDSELDGLRY